MSVAELPIPLDREQIARFYRERGIRKLSLFGSVLHRDFNPQHSDVDVLAEFEPGVLSRPISHAYAGAPVCDRLWGLGLPKAGHRPTLHAVADSIGV